MLSQESTSELSKEFVSLQPSLTLYIDSINEEELAIVYHANDKIQKFEERLVNFQIEIKTVEKCMREDITNLNSYKMDAYKGEKLRSELEDLKHKVANGDNNLDSRITQVSKTVDTDVKNKIKASEKSIIGITQLLKEMTARFNMFENRMEDFFKSTPSEAPVKRQEVDQERLRYLGKLSI